MARLRLRLPGTEGTDGNVQGSLRDHPPDVDRGLSDLQGEVLHDRPPHQRAERRPEAAPTAVDRRDGRTSHPPTSRANSCRPQPGRGTRPHPGPTPRAGRTTPSRPPPP